MRENQKITSLAVHCVVGFLITTKTTLSDHTLPLKLYGNDSTPIAFKAIDSVNCQAQLENTVEVIPCQSSSDDSPLFDTNPILFFSTQIDLRPENCQSYFDDYLPTRRGLRIETALEDTAPFNGYKKTVDTFPVIDFIAGRTAHVVKSKDLSSNTYISDSINPLYNNIMQDAEEIKTRLIDNWKNGETISAKVHGITTQIGKDEVNEFTLHIVIQTGIASPKQITQIQQAGVDLIKQWGIKLKVIEIP